MTQSSRHSDQSLNKKSGFLWGTSVALIVALIFARLVYPEYLWLTVGVGVLLVISLGSLIHFNRQALKSRSTAYGLNSFITVLLVIAIVGVLDFLTSRYPYKIDMTKNKIHTLSEQTIKAVKGLKEPVHATFFAKIGQREQFRPLLENYKAISPKFEVEYIDPDREPTRTKEDGIKKYGTLHLQVGTRESNVDEMTEEKITNALIKLTRDKIPTLCAIVGHGEKSFSSTEADGYAQMKKALTDESYAVQDVNLLQEGKLPTTCDGLAVIGPEKSFFPAEMKVIGDYLANGGRAVIAIDLDIKGPDYAPELISLLRDWYVSAEPSMVIDPVSRQFGVDASAPIVANYSKESPITKDFSLQNITVFPFLRPLDTIPSGPVTLKVEGIAKTTPNSLLVTNLKQIASGQVAVDPSKTKPGPFNGVVTVSGKLKDSKASRDTRIVVFGSSNFANNNYSRYGSNSDLFLNAVGWIMEDQNMISIRAKEEGQGLIEMTQKEGVVIGLLTVFVIPLMIAAAGVLVWAVRKRM